MNEKIFFVIIFHIFLIINKMNCNEKQTIYKCNHENDEGINALPNRVFKLSPKQKDEQRRRMDSELIQMDLKILIYI